MKNELQKAEQDAPQSSEMVDMGRAMVSMLERVIMDPSIPIDRIEKMMEMRERWEAQQAEKAYSEAMAAAKAEMPQVLKNKKNQQTNSRYADLEAIDKAISPVISKHGFSLSFAPAKSELANHYGIICEIRHQGGHKVTHFADIPADGVGMKGNTNKTATHAFGSTMSYGRRYLKSMIFDIATGDDDGNAAGSGEPITSEQMKKLESLIDETNTDIAAFCRYMRIECLAEMPLTKFGAAEKALEAKKGKGNV